jgi:hypothetical protein
MVASRLVEDAIKERDGCFNSAEALLNELLDYIIILETHRGRDAGQEGWDMFER